MRLDNDPKRWLTPKKYTLNVAIDLEAYEFRGSVDIEVEAATSYRAQEDSGTLLVLHAKELEFPSGATALIEGSKKTSVETSIDASQEIVSFRFEDDIASQSPTHVTIAFEGKLTDCLAGLYRSFYSTSSGERRCMAVTQFEATDARRAFPCFDDPALKAVFELTVTAPADRLCISNTPVVETNTVQEAGTKLCRFAPTPKMSTYLLAIVVGEFDVVTGYSQRGVLGSVYVPLGRSREGQFALDVACKALDFYEHEYGVDYPLQKQDLLAIPDFAAGAMENWGCVTYREARLLVDEKMTSVSARFSVARVVCHELAHQWFGNLVTMKWWEDLFLNEGFARFMEFAAVSHIFPDWDAWTIFVQDVQALALHLDSLQTTHPVRVEVRDAAAISEAFDAISYAKGASIIRMLESFLGHDVFMQGIRKYLERHAYENAELSDLLTCIEEANADTVASGEITSLMDAWTTAEGYPVVILTEKEGSIQAHQERFLYSPTKSASADDARWIVPMKIRAGGETAQTRKTLDSPDAWASLSAELTALDKGGQWFNLNADMSGFYRVCYTESQWTRLLDQMAARQDATAPIGSSDPSDLGLSNTDRLGLVRDAFYCAVSGYSPLAVPLRLFLGLMPKLTEKDPAVLRELTLRLQSLAQLYRDESFFEEFARKLIVPCCKPIMDEVALLAPEEGEESMAKINLRVAVLKTLALAPASALPDNDESLFDKAVALTKAHYAADGGSAKPIPANVRLAVFQLAAKDEAAPVELYELLNDRFVQGETSLAAEEKRDLLATLASFAQHDALVERVVEYAVSDQIRAQDLALVVHTLCASSHKASKLMWEHISTEYERIFAKYGSIGFQWGAFLGGTVRGLRTQSELDEVSAFFETHEKGAAAQALGTAIETVQARIDRVNNEAPQVKAFLAELEA
ncbi:Aminopeptidase M1 [Hondaea fermentalgiana]|uniref:Aminopeptidase n=1 Tax=Hondaea fermentalgiana TaxID=2315210 RepID=A0A2R5GGY0_9STRA|nr:Aminopeptidase M1 [Hondaea fermentalgiana]|eukprot:GBG27903.1 Aminopeptidase M1 [Hondaea fermentalgiana]